MTWIKFLITNHIKYNLYKIEKDDSVIIKTLRNNQIIIILFGISYITENFINQEISPLTILTTNSIFTINQSNRNIYHQIIPLKTTYILSIEENQTTLINNTILKMIYKNILNKYTQDNYKIINTVIRQKNVTNRIIQLIMIFSLYYGKFQGREIYIPFNLSNQNIAILTGTSQNTVAKIMSKIYKKGIVKKIHKTMIGLNHTNYLKSE